MFVQLYAEDGDTIAYSGIYFESSSDLGNEVPHSGDVIICPLHKAEFEPRDPDRHFAFEIVRRYFLPDITKSQADLIKVIARRRALTSGERAFF